MTVFVDNDAGLEGAISIRGRLCPNVHPHPSVLSIGRGGEVSIVGAGAVLRVEDDEVVTLATLSVVIGFEVAGLLGEAEVIQ